MANTESYTLGGGKLYIRRYADDGVTLGDMFDFGVTDNVTMNTKVDYVEHKNTESKEERIDLKLVKDRQVTLKFNTSEITPDMLALALLGEQNTKAQTAGNVTGEEHTSGAVNSYFALGKVNVDVTKVTYNDGTNDVELVEGKDYIVKSEEGLIQTLTDVASNTTLKVDYSWTDAKINIVEAVKKAKVLAQLIFINDPQNGVKAKYTFYKVQLQSDGDITLKSTDKFMEISFTGECLFTGDLDKPYYNIEMIGA